MIFTPIRFPGTALGLPAGDYLNSDQWDGYQADQAALIEHLDATPASHGDAVFLTGDIHSSWAMDVPVARTTAYRSAGVEFVCPSVTSDGFYELVRASAKGAPAPAVVQQTRGLTRRGRGANPWVRYLDGIGHGFVVLDVTSTGVQADYYLTPVPTAALPDPRVDPTVEPAYATSWRTMRPTRRVVAAEGPVGASQTSRAPAEALGHRSVRGRAELAARGYLTR